MREDTHHGTKIANQKKMPGGTGTPANRLSIRSNHFNYTINNRTRSVACLHATELQ
jgi:hypothetical protein